MALVLCKPTFHVLLSLLAALSSMLSPVGHPGVVRHRVLPGQPAQLQVPVGLDLPDEGGFACPLERRLLVEAVGAVLTTAVLRVAVSAEPAD